MEKKAPATGAQSIRIGISRCLLGDAVRYDGGHKRDAYINGTLAALFEFVPVCPELAVGLGVPREPVHLVRRQGRVRVVGTRSADLDVTEALEDYGRRMARELAPISGYILKKDSPSCGMERVKVRTAEGRVQARDGVGAYARTLMESRPLLPVEEEGRLGDPVLRENFIQRVIVYHRWQRLQAEGMSAQRLVDFHTEHKYMVMAHSQAACKRLGGWVALAGSEPLEPLAERYIAELMVALKRRATRRRHANVLSHLMGYLRDVLDVADRAELAETIEAYRQGRVPLIVPITLLRHHFHRHPHPYIERQRYLAPHPPELMLRNGL